MMMDQDQLSPEERVAFETMQSQHAPSSQLEERIVQSLKEEGLIQNKRTMNTFIKTAIGLAASIIIFFAGNYVGQQSKAIETLDPLNGYIMILKEDANFRPGDPIDMFNEYSGWMNALDKKGVKIMGQELKPEAFEVTTNSVKPLSGVKGQRTTGYFLIETSNEQEALAVVRDNPHLKYGGIIELKAFMNR